MSTTILKFAMARNHPDDSADQCSKECGLHEAQYRSNNAKDELVCRRHGCAFRRKGEPGTWMRGESNLSN